MVHYPSRKQALVMRVGAAVLAPFGVLLGVLYVFLVVPTLLAVLGSLLLLGYHKVARGRFERHRAWLWLASLLFNAPGVALLFSAPDRWLGLWPLMASAISASAIWSEVAARHSVPDRQPAASART
ncbi:MAG: hypothetical protein Q8S33_20160 [Myxococcales bacterium]|nr:hypothetical protein [Myxococcales bacterium]